MDINGQALTDAGRSFAPTIRGDGDDGTGGGAIVNSETSFISVATGKSGIRNLIFPAAASVGGSGSFDIGTGTGGSVDGGGFTLTKTGSGAVLINGPAKNLKTVVDGGTLSTIVDEGFGYTVLVRSGATEGNIRTSSPYNHSVNVTVEKDGTLQSNTSVTWNGSFAAEGNLVIKIDQVTSAVMTFPNAVSIPGNLLSKGAASGSSLIMKVGPQGFEPWTKGL